VVSDQRSSCEAAGSDQWIGQVRQEDSVVPDSAGPRPAVVSERSVAMDLAR